MSSGTRYGRGLPDALREFIAALDRHQPQRDRHGECVIVRDAASLCGEAAARLNALEREDGLEPHDVQ